MHQDQWMTLTVDIHIGSCTHLVNCIYQLLIIDYNSFWKIHCFTFFPYKSIRDQIWPCRKIGQGQPRIIIWTNLAVLELPKLYTKFKDHQPFGSREEDLRFLPYIRSPIPWRHHMKFDFDWPSGFWGEDVWRVWMTNDDDRGLPIL